MPFTEDEFRNWWAAQRRAADDAIVEDGIPRTPGRWNQIRLKSSAFEPGLFSIHFGYRWRCCLVRDGVSTGYSVLYAAYKRRIHAVRGPLRRMGYPSLAIGG